MKSILIIVVALASIGVMASSTLVSGKNHHLNSNNMKSVVKEKQGVNTFLKQPSKYNFLCTETSKGEVIDASLSESGKMVIEYASFWEDGDHSGKAVGFYDSKKNRFNGTYKTHDGRFTGEMNFSFNEKGEATGTWDNGFGTIKIRLKE